MKHRRHGTRLKYEHEMIDGLRGILEQIQAWPEVRSVIPARIKPTRTGLQGKRLWLKVQGQTGTGIKVIAHGNGKVQEVFVVSGDPDALTARIEHEYDQ